MTEVGNYMRNKFICLILAVMSLLHYTSVLAEEKTGNEEAEAFAVNMGYIDAISDNYVSRAKFAESIYKLLQLNNEVNDNPEISWFEGVFEPDNSNVLISGSNTSEEMFDDVSVNDDCYEYVMGVVNSGLMNGYSETLFVPGENITYYQAYKVFVKIIGFNINAINNGGYPVGYYQEAMKHGLTKGVTGSGNDNITFRELAKIIYNASKSEVLITEYKTDRFYYTQRDDINILGIYADIYKSTGVVIRNQYTSVDSKIKSAGGTINISGTEYECNDEEAYMLIGKRVDFYYKDDDGEKRLVYAYESAKNKTITILADDIVEFDDYSLIYIEGEKEKRIKLTPGASMIYNGVYKSGYDAETFMLADGSIAVTDIGDGKGYNLIVIDEYRSAIVSGINGDEKEFFIKSAPNEPANRVVSDDTYQIRYYNADGEETDFGALNIGINIEIAQSEDLSFTKIYVGGEAYEITVSGIAEEDEDYVIKSTDGQKYYIADNLTNYITNNVRLGGSYIITINRSGKVSWIKNVLSADSKEYAYVISCKLSDEDDESIFLKVFTQNSAILTYNIGENVYINNNGKKKKIKNIVTRHSALQESVDTIIMLEYNDDGEVIGIDIPSSNGERNDVFGVMSSGTDVAYSSAPEAMFENRTMLLDAVIFSINSDETDENKKYSIISTGALSDGQKYNEMKAYNKASNSVIADAVIVYIDTNDNNTSSKYFEKLYIVNKITTELNAYDEPVRRMRGYSVSTDRVAVDAVLDAEIGQNGMSAFDNMRDCFGNSGYILKEGDVFVATLINNTIDGAYILYRSKEINASNTKGIMAGTNNLYTGSNKNPFALNSNMTINTGDISKYRTGDPRLFAGYVCDIEKSRYITYTNNPTGNGFVTREGVVTETTVLPSKFTVVDTENYTIKEGNVSDIKTYESFGVNCSRIFIQYQSGRPRKVIIFN